MEMTLNEYSGLTHSDSLSLLTHSEGETQSNPEVADELLLGFHLLFLKRRNPAAAEEESMGNWADLPPELVSLISQKIHLYRDFFFFGLVCKPWQSATSSISNFHGPDPTRWLLLAGDEEEEDATDECSLIGLTKGLTKLVLPEIKRKRCFESLGWLLTIGGDGEVSLLNPFSRVQISLPSVYGLEHFENESGDVGTNLSAISKTVLSSNPSETDNYMVFVIYCSCELMSFWRAGESNWTSVPTPMSIRIGHIYDILYCNDNLYYVDHHRTVYRRDITRGPHVFTRLVEEFKLDIEHYMDFRQAYLVEGDPGELLLVLRDGIDLRFFECRKYKYNLNIVLERGVTQFKVFSTNSMGLSSSSSSSSSWVEKTSLGNRALFLGKNASVSVDTSRLPGVKPNCIYYTDDFWPSYYQFENELVIYHAEDGTFETISRIGQLFNLSRTDMAIYHMEDGTMDTLLNGQSVTRKGQPIWVTPSRS